LSIVASRSAAARANSTAFWQRLDPADAVLSARLRGLITRLVRDAAEHVMACSMGEIAAIVQRSHEVLTALAAEAEDPDDRQCRYRSRAAVLNLLVLADGVARFHAATRAQQRKSVDALRDLVADALSGLVERAA
jgi:hypothetical protein